jgi:HEAT repeat protein
MPLFRPNTTRMEKRQDVDGLIAALGHRDGAVRESAAAALGRLGWTPRDSSERARYLIARGAWEELSEVGDPAIGPLLAALESEEKDTAESAEAALREWARRSPDTVVEHLVRALVEDSRRHRVADVLAATGDPRAIEPLIQTLRHEQPMLIVPEGGEPKLLGRAADLVSFGEPAVEPLIRALGEGSVNLQASAAFVLGRIGDPRAAEPLAQALERNDPRRLQPAIIAEALGQLGEAAVAPLLRVAYHKDWQIACAAVGTLGKIGDARATGPLVQLLGHRSVPTRAAAAWALGEIGDPRAVEPLKRALKDLPVSTAAAEALSKTKDIPAMLYAVGSGALLRTRLIEAARGIGPPAVAPLVEGLSSRKDNVRVAARDALCALGPEAASAVQALIPMMDNRQGGRRLDAVMILGRIGPQAMAAVPHLIQELVAGATGFLDRSAASLALRAITGQDLGKDVTVWQTWWEQHLGDAGCPRCGQAPKADNRFCTGCGARIR